MHTSQNRYTKEVREAVVPHNDMAYPEVALDIVTRKAFWSLLGALVWLLVTGVDSPPLIVYQRGVAQTAA